MQRLLTILFSIAPFVAGAIAALGARHDMRMLWMALVATLVAWVAVGVLAKQNPVVESVVAFVAAFVTACLVAVLFGARGAFGVVAVAAVLAGFATAGAVLGRRARSQRSSVSPR